jgi:hypothetical protein
MGDGSSEPSPKTFTEYIDKLLLNSLDSGIKEVEFWDMTIAEIVREIESKNRIFIAEAKYKASSDYILASLITRGVSIVLGSKESFPPIEEVYPNLYADADIENKKRIEQKNNLSTLRFLQFAQSYNQRFKNKEVPEEINE